MSCHVSSIERLDDAVGDGDELFLFSASSGSILSSPISNLRVFQDARRMIGLALESSTAIRFTEKSIENR